jgi:hypothetical protein
MYRVIQKEVYTLKHWFYKYYWPYGDVLYFDWRKNSQSYFHTLQALDVSPSCDAADVKSTIQLFSRLYQSQIDFLVGGFFPERVRKCRCTLDTDVVLANPSTQKAFPCALAAILNTTSLGRYNYCVRTWREIQIRTLRDFLSNRTWI